MWMRKLNKRKAPWESPLSDSTFRLLPLRASVIRTQSPSPTSSLCDQTTAQPGSPTRFRTCCCLGEPSSAFITSASKSESLLSGSLQIQCRDVLSFFWTWGHACGSQWAEELCIEETLSPRYQADPPAPLALLLPSCAIQLWLVC